MWSLVLLLVFRLASFFCKILQLAFTQSISEFFGVGDTVSIDSRYFKSTFQHQNSLIFPNALIDNKFLLDKSRKLEGLLAHRNLMGENERELVKKGGTEKIPESIREHVVAIHVITRCTLLTELLK